LPDDEQWTIDNKPQAVRRLMKAEIKRNRKKQLGRMLVICEATGGYELHVLDVALEMGLSVHGAHGTRVRHFGHYRGLLAKIPQDVIELMSYFQPVQPGQAVCAIPGAGLDVPIWILGSSLFGAQLAAALGEGDRDRAIADFDEAIRIDPNHANAFNSRGNAYYAKGDRNRAIADYDRAIAINPALNTALVRQRRDASH
jgi:tetratricopeptide (TPR) repeat protein